MDETQVSKELSVKMVKGPLAQMEKRKLPGGDWGQEEKGMTEDEMAGWHHRLDGHEFE